MGVRSASRDHVGYKQDRQGLGIRRRQKKRLAAAQIVVYRNALAHNVLFRIRRWLVLDAPELERWRRAPDYQRRPSAKRSSATESHSAYLVAERAHLDQTYEHTQIWPKLWYDDVVDPTA